MGHPLVVYVNNILIKILLLQNHPQWHFQMKDFFLLDFKAARLRKESESDNNYRIYALHYTMPLTVFSQICESAIKEIKWSSVYFNNLQLEVDILNQKKKSDGKENKSKQMTTPQLNNNFKSNINEFYLLDLSNNLHIWNLNKSVNVSIYLFFKLIYLESYNDY